MATQRKRNGSKCEHCGVKKGEVHVDPYVEELEGKRVLVVLCEGCLQERYDSI